MALTITVGTNSYLTLADAEAYALRLYGPRATLWSTQTDATKNALLAQACLDIDSCFWNGEKTASTQTLEFPREGDATTDDSYTKVEQAQVEQALHLLTYNQERREAIAGMGVNGVSVGGISEQYAGGTLPRLCQRSRELLREWMNVGASLR
jgi:hypothetical protein